MTTVEDQFSPSTPWVQVIKQVVKLGSRHLYPLTPLASLFPSSSGPLFRLKHKYGTWFLLTLAKKFRITWSKLTFLPVYWNKKVNNYIPFIMGKKKIHVRYANIFLFTKSSKRWKRQKEKRDYSVKPNDRALCLGMQEFLYSTKEKEH